MHRAATQSAPNKQDLNVPRCRFDGSGIDAFQGLSFDQRVDFLGRALRGTAPKRRPGREDPTGARRGAFEEVVGGVSGYPAGTGGLERAGEIVRGEDVGPRCDRHRVRHRFRQVGAVDSPCCGG